MSDYAVSQVYPSDKRSLAGVDALLHREHTRFTDDKHRKICRCHL